MDFEASVVVYTHENKYYLQFFGSRYLTPEKSEFVQTLIKENKLVDYHYQNQSDPWFYYDESIDSSRYDELEAEYMKREQVWDEIFHDDKSFSQTGVVKEFKPSMIDVDLYSIYAGAKDAKKVQDTVPS
jgi:hypothetical protein